MAATSADVKGTEPCDKDNPTKTQHMTVLTAQQELYAHITANRYDRPGDALKLRTCNGTLGKYSNSTFRHGTASLLAAATSAVYPPSSCADTRHGRRRRSHGFTNSTNAERKAVSRCPQHDPLWRRFYKYKSNVAPSPLRIDQHQHRAELVSHPHCHSRQH